MEIYRDSSQQLPFRLYVGRTLTDADSIPTVSLKLNGITLPPKSVAHDATGLYSISLGFADTFEEGELEADWSFSLGGNASVKKEYHSVVTPYADINYLYELDKTDVEMLAAEKFARIEIEKFTGQKFGRRKAWVVSQGTDTDILVLPERVISVTHIYENGNIAWEDGSTTNAIRSFEITKSGFALKCLDLDDPIEHYTGNSMRTGGKFALDRTYEVIGEFGYQRVPEDVSMCANMLVDDFFCKDRAWREKYANKITSGDWSVEINQRAFTGTGNSIVDAILADYVWHRMVVI